MNSWTDIQTDRPKETDIDRQFFLKIEIEVQTDRNVDW